MTLRFGMWKKILCAIFCACLLMGASAQAAIERTVDPSTLDDWKKFMGPDASGNLSTENAGGIWTDKSVFEDKMEDGSNSISAQDDHFLVALSAIGSNSAVTGMSTLPTDTMLVLDVSGSMSDNYKDVAQELVNAANETVSSLLEMNPYNRVGVVVYSGSHYDTNENKNAAVLMLPLGRYTTQDNSGRYFEYRKQSGTETISLHSGVYMENSSQKPASTRKDIVGATYIQKGIHLAMQQFTAAGNATTVQDPALGTLQRKPVMVLMSDGAPTLASTSFTSPGQRNMGDGNTSTSAIGFVTQLTASYAKTQVEARYGVDSLFYTLGLGLDNSPVAKSVLDPRQSSNAIQEFWKNYQALNTKETLAVQGNDRKVTRIAEKLDQYYVDSYFSADDGADMIAMFEQIVNDIELQSRYLPTLVEESEELSGYVSFVDRIGEYMEVKRVHGVLIGGVLHTGEQLSRNFVTGGGDLGTYTDPTSLGDELVWSVQSRMGLTDADEARTLIGNAYRHGQLSYGGEGVFSNYIGWYADENGRYLGFWAEGETTVPEGAAYCMKSYGYLGETDEAHGVAASDMMYTTVRVRRDIVTGEEMVSFAVPAALLPLLTYDITLDENNEIAGLDVNSAAPIRLVYEVGLREGINEYTLTQMVDADYLEANTDEAGQVYFYTNQYEKDGSTGYQRMNSYSYFRPSSQNERYYYLKDVRILAADHKPYTGSSAPSGKGWTREHTIYVRKDGKHSSYTGYHELAAAVLDYAQKHADGFWYIPAGTVHLNTEEYVQTKISNSTGTLLHSNAPYVDINSIQGGGSYIIGATLGNNGRISLTPTAGFRIRKTVTPESAANETETFTINIVRDATDQETKDYPALIVAADGTETSTTVSFKNGEAAVDIRHGDTLYISGMDDANRYIISEAETAKYKLVSINHDTTLASIPMQPSLSSPPEAHFVNTPKGTGSLTISKVVEHPLGTDYDVTKKFAINVQLTGPATANKTFTATGAVTSVPTDADGKFTVNLTHNEQITLTGLPEGTVAVVTEPNPGEGFTASYYVNTQPTTGTSGTVTIAADGVSSVTVNNKYQPSSARANVQAFVIKRFEDEWDENYEFHFELHEYDLQTGAWKPAALGTATADAKDTLFELKKNSQSAFANVTYPAPGEYYYRFVEKQDNPIEGVIYDQTVHGFTVVVGDADMDGKLEVTDVHDDRDSIACERDSSGTWKVTATFTNRAVPVADVMIDLNKAVTNASGSPLGSAHGFTFALYNNAECTGTPVATSQETNDRGFARLVLEYTAEQAGTYRYWLKEIPDADRVNGWTYTQKKIPVSVLVSISQEDTVTAVIWQGNEEKPEDAGTGLSVTFTNIYDAADAVLKMDFISKALENKALEAGMFEFALYEETNMDTPVQKAFNTADGRVAFKDLTFDEVGTFYYLVKELTGDGNGYVTDKTTYRIEVTVTDNNGTLKASHKVLNTAADTITFRNVYDPAEIAHAISGQKTLNGRALLNNEFYFVLAESDADGNEIEGGRTWHVGNQLDGSFAFEPITYTLPGEYYYTVHEEDAANKQGIQYDPVERLVKVTVTDNGSGVLSASSEVTINNAVQDGLHFINNYVPSSVEAAISGVKRLRGRTLQAEQFRFELYAADENGVPQGEPLETVTHDGQGAFAFAPRTYHKAGTYRYIVQEVKGGQIIDEITYDTMRYFVTVEVTDNLRGELSAVVVAHDEYLIPQEGVVFINTYGVVGGGTVRLQGAKMLTGREQKDGEFTFELYQTGADYLVADGQQPWLTVGNVGGRFAFELMYGSEHMNQIFYYVLREKNAGQIIDGIEYSDQTYQIMVMVEAGRDGMVETITVIHSDDKLAQNVLFINHARASGSAGQQPPTGDRSTPLLWLMLLTGSAAVLYTSYRRRRLHG